MDASASSIHVLAPLESGGTDARRGFSFQDHVAAGFCLRMLEDGSDLVEVWCETHDDVTLIRSVTGGEEVEFVQVKASEPDQLWTPALLCSAGSGGVETSVLGRSLSQDRCAEPVSFRIVTARPPNSELAPLTHPLSSEERVAAAGEMDELKARVRQKARALASANGNSTDFWLERTVWDARHDQERVRLANEALIRDLAERAGEILVSDQIQEIHQRLLGLVKRAAEEEWAERGESKKLSRKVVRQWFIEAIERAAHPARTGIATNLRRKMEAAQLAEEEIVSASDLRRRYRATVLSPKYIGADERQIVEGEVQALLSRQRSLLDSGQIQDSGVAFHARCLDELHQLRGTLPQLSGIEGLPPEHVLQGFMYNLVDRCPHRFVEASP